MLWPYFKYCNATGCIVFLIMYWTQWIFSCDIWSKSLHTSHQGLFLLVQSLWKPRRTLRADSGSRNCTGLPHAWAKESQVWDMKVCESRIYCDRQWCCKPKSPLLEMRVLSGICLSEKPGEKHTPPWISAYKQQMKWKGLGIGWKLSGNQCDSSQAMVFKVSNHYVVLWQMKSFSLKRKKVTFASKFCFSDFWSVSFFFVRVCVPISSL